MDIELSYNQLVFGLMLIGAKADGKLQEEEKHLLVELTSEEHHLSAEDYRNVISHAKQYSDEEFEKIVFDLLNTHSQEDRVKAAYWLLQVIESDDSSNDSDDEQRNMMEWNTYQRSITQLKVSEEEIQAYKESRGEE